MSFFKKIFAGVIQKNKRLENLIRTVYHYRTWKPKGINDLEKILEAYNNYKSGKVSFIQIGSNDGLHGDPIYKLVKKYKWHGILVEPVPEIFERLKNNYRDNSHHLIFENIAITKNRNGLNEFYSVRNDDNALPGWVNQLGSFEKNVILKHTEYHPEIKERVMVTQIRTDSLENMIRRNNFQNINLVHIDTEGYDFEILNQINFDQYLPDIILYEHKHLGSRNYKGSIKLLKEKGYKLFVHQGDTLAIQLNLITKIKIQ